MSKEIVRNQQEDTSNDFFTVGLGHTEMQVSYQWQKNKIRGCITEKN